MKKEGHLRLVSPATKNRTVTPRRPKNADMRTREYLTDSEINKLMKAASNNRYGHRDATTILVCYRHGFRAVELVDLRYQIDFNAANIAVRRVKRGSPATHPIRGDELRALRRLQREQEPKSSFVFNAKPARSLPWSQEHPAYGQIYRTGAGSVQGILALKDGALSSKRQGSIV